LRLGFRRGFLSQDTALALALAKQGHSEGLMGKAGVYSLSLH
jgi:hypothetical protein